jgi:hypothetical protein
MFVPLLVSMLSVALAADTREVSELCPVYSPFFGAMGAASALVFCIIGSAYGTAKSGVGIASVGVLKPDFIIRSLVPVIFAAAGTCPHPPFFSRQGIDAVPHPPPTSSRRFAVNSHVYLSLSLLLSFALELVSTV